MQVSLEALKKRHAQGWLHELESDLDNVIQRIREAKSTKQVHRRLDLRKSLSTHDFGSLWRSVQCSNYVDLREKGHIISHASPSASKPMKGASSI